MQDPRIDKLAKVLVHYSIGAKADQLVRVAGPVAAEPLIIEEIMYKHGSDSQLQYISPMSWTMVEQMDATIRILGSQNTKSLTNCDPARQALRSAGQKPFKDRFFDRAAKDELNWTLTQFPCPASAQDAEMSLGEYEDFVFSAGLLDYDDPAAEWRKRAECQDRLAEFLNGKNEIHITTPQGTDIRFGVEGRKWINCCGHENFPDGEVFTGPIEDATEGTAVYSFPACHGGREVSDIILKFKAGKVVDATAGKNEEFLIKMLDQDEGSRTLGELAFGTNYAITHYTTNTLFDEKIGGTFHAAVGSGYPETGSKNSSGLHWDMICDLREGGVVEADGERISESGKFAKNDWPGI